MKNHWEWQWCARIQQKCFLKFLKIQKQWRITVFYILCFTLWPTWSQSSSHRWWADSFICRPWTFSVSWDDFRFFFQQKIFIITVKNNNTRKLAQSLNYLRTETDGVHQSWLLVLIQSSSVLSQSDPNQNVWMELWSNDHCKTLS